MLKTIPYSYPFRAELRKMEKEEQYKTPLNFGYLIAKILSGVDIGSDVVAGVGFAPTTSWL